MLTLTRQTGEAIFVGSNIQVVVLSVKGNQVRIRINAPRDAVVDREEIHQRKQHQALRPTPDS